jgi:hypothetical protein
VESPAADQPDSPKCKWLLALLSPSPRPGNDLCEALEKAFGPIEYKGEALPFDFTDYYREEFGPGLHRAFWAFRGVDGPERLPDLKRAASALEALWMKGGKRAYNLDMGYMDPDKVVLGSFKRGPCKLYLKDGVYADLLLRYSRGCFEPMPWAFTDFKDGRYQKSLLVIREKLKSDLRKDRKESSGDS